MEPVASFSFQKVLTSSQIYSSGQAILPVSIYSSWKKTQQAWSYVCSWVTLFMLLLPFCLGGGCLRMTQQFNPSDTICPPSRCSHLTAAGQHTPITEHQAETTHPDHQNQGVPELGQYYEPWGTIRTVRRWSNGTHSWDNTHTHTHLWSTHSPWNAALLFPFSRFSTIDDSQLRCYSCTCFIIFILNCTENLNPVEYVSHIKERGHTITGRNDWHTKRPTTQKNRQGHHFWCLGLSWIFLLRAKSLDMDWLWALGWHLHLKHWYAPQSILTESIADCGSAVRYQGSCRVLMWLQPHPKWEGWSRQGIPYLTVQHCPLWSLRA